MNSLPSEKIAISGMIDPQFSGAGTYLSDAINFSEFESALAIVAAGDLNTGNTLDAKLVQATTLGGTYKDITGKAITQFDQTNGDSNKQALINCRAEDLDVANSYIFVKLSITHAGTGQSKFSGNLLGVNSAYRPASEQNVSSVVEIVD